MNTDVDPETIIKIVKGTAGKKDRSFLMSRNSMLGKVKLDKMAESYVSISIKKISEGIFRIEFDNELESGEYAFMPFSSTNLQGNVAGSGTFTQTIYCFGIDK